MTKIIQASYDGQVFYPQSPVDIEPDRMYKITIEDMPATAQVVSAWDVLDQLAGTVAGPEDWSENHDHYRLGVSKRADDGE